MHTTIFYKRPDVSFQRGKVCVLSQLYATFVTQETQSIIFSGRAHWLDIATALSDRPLTMAECARRLGLANSVVRRPLHEMHKAGLLEADAESPSHGTHYWLREGLVDQLEKEVRESQPSGKVLEGQAVLTIEEIGPLDLANALMATDLTRCVIWVAELGPGGSFLVILDGKHTSATAHGRLIAAIEGAGGSCKAGQATRIMDVKAWRRLLAAYRDAAA